MSKAYTGASMSLDGFIAGPEEGGFEHLFAWYGDGDVEVPTAQEGWAMRMTPANAALFRDQVAETGALVVGRRLFDLTSGWGGTHPLGLPVVVVTHRAPGGWPADTPTPFHFATDGIEAALALAAEVAGDRWVGVNGGEMARQALEAGLIDEVRVALVPVLLGGGVPLVGALGTAPRVLEGPTVVEGTHATHLCYRVAR